MSQEMKNALIAAMIRREFQSNGGDVEAAFDSVMGKGAYMKMAGEVYNQLRAK